MIYAEIPRPIYKQKPCVQVFAEMRKEKEAAADASAVWDSIEVTPETVEALTDEDWAQLKEVDRQLADLEKAGMTVSAKQARPVQSLVSWMILEVLF